MRGRKMRHVRKAHRPSDGQLALEQKNNGDIVLTAAGINPMGRPICISVEFSASSSAAVHAALLQTLNAIQEDNRKES